MKCFKIRRIYKAPVSPPARGAWIEIPKAYTSFIKVRRRPPHGGRGLKCIADDCPLKHVLVAPRTGGVD